MNPNGKLKASIITIGDELLIGQTIDTNSAWIASTLNNIGISIERRVAVGDEWGAIWSTLEEESKKSSIILITGGLGPTNDESPNTHYASTSNPISVLTKKHFST